MSVNNDIVYQHVLNLTAKDPNSGVYTTYMPIWYIMQILNHIGFTSQTDVWNGSLATPTWNLSSSAAPIKPTSPSSANAYELPSVPASGILPTFPFPTAAQIASNPSLVAMNEASNWSNGQTSTEAINITGLVYDPNNPNFLIAGTVVPNAGRAMPPYVWVRIPGSTSRWDYAVPVSSTGAFSAALTDPFSANPVNILVGPYLTTVQTATNGVLQAGSNPPQYLQATNVSSIRFDVAQSAEIDDVAFTYSRPRLDTLQRGLLASNWVNYVNPSTITLADSITQGIASPLAKAQVIYNWIMNNLRYNSAEVENNDYVWSTTGEVLAAKSGICVDYADVYEALSRAVGISTEEIAGIGIASNADGSHQWDRSWINGAWVYADPTFSQLYLTNSGFVGPSTPYKTQPEYFNFGTNPTLMADHQEQEYLTR